MGTDIVWTSHHIEDGLYRAEGRDSLGHQWLAVPMLVGGHYHTHRAAVRRADWPAAITHHESVVFETLPGGAEYMREVRGRAVCAAARYRRWLARIAAR